MKYLQSSDIDGRFYGNIDILEMLCKTVLEYAM